MSSLQEYADTVVAQQWRQSLKTLAEALNRNCWAVVDRPECCGQEVEITTFIGDPYLAECTVCGKFAASMDAPHYSNSSVASLDHGKFPKDTDWSRTWIVGVKPE